MGYVAREILNGFLVRGRAAGEVAFSALDFLGEFQEVQRMRGLF